MKYRLKLSRQFEFDLIEMDINLADFPNKAQRLMQKIEKSLNSLIDTPKMYQVYDDFPIFRRIVIEDYIVFYTIDEANHSIEIHRLIYGRMDFNKQFE